MQSQNRNITAHNFKNHNLKMMMLDNYDSFTYNLVQYFQILDVHVEVLRSDDITAIDLIEQVNFIVISPGPSDPQHAGQSLPIIARASQLKKPLLGICLGHQCVGHYFGGIIKRSPAPVHGKTTQIRHNNKGIFENIPANVLVTRYHSLVVAKDGLPDCLEITAELHDGLIMGLKHRSLPIEGVQFHPESVLSENGLDLLANFIHAHVVK